MFAYDGRNVFGAQTSGEDDIFGGLDLVAPGWGLIMVGVGSFALVLTSGFVLLRGTHSTSEDNSPPSL